MPETRTASFLQTISHLLVVGAGIVYLFGFIIVSVFDASYGIADFSLFRTKVIAVGTLFVFLLASHATGFYQIVSTSFEELASNAGSLIAWFLLEKAHPLVLHCKVNMSI